MDIDLLMASDGATEPFECFDRSHRTAISGARRHAAENTSLLQRNGSPVPRSLEHWRCILESLQNAFGGLAYRKAMREIEAFTRQRFSRPIFSPVPQTYVEPLYGECVGCSRRFLPSPNAAAERNVMVQALALGHIKTLKKPRDIVRRSFKLEAISHMQPRGMLLTAVLRFQQCRRVDRTKAFVYCPKNGFGSARLCGSLAHRD